MRGEDPLTIALVVGFLALLAAGTSLVLCTRLALQLRELERTLAAIPSTNSLPEPSLTLPKPPSPLQGLRIALSIRQDHPHSVFANLLREQLLKEDVSEVTIVETNHGAPEADILIAGEIACNGYAEVYYRAELSASAGKESICTLVEKPPDGDRPANLAIEFVALLSAKLDVLVSRSERRRALRELGLG